MSETTLEPVIVTANRDTAEETGFPQGFSLEAVTIKTDFGQDVDVRNLTLELSFFEDIYSFVVSGYVILKDAIGIVENYKLDGNEFINIKYGSYRNEDDENKLSRTFRIYKIGRNPIGNLNSEYISIYFCSEILLLSEQLKISKSYSGKQIATKNDNSGIINNILIEKLKIDSKKLIDIEEPYGLYDFVVPNFKPLEAISWLSTYARPKSNKVGADMLFFETKDGFQFRSIQSLISEKPYATYKYQPKNVDFGDDDMEQGFTTVLDYEVVKTYDTLGSISDGAYANRLLSIDPLTRSHKVTDFSYSDYFKQTKTDGQNPIVSPSVNSQGLTETESFESKMKVAFGNSNQGDIQYIKDRIDGVAKDIFIETYVYESVFKICKLIFIYLFFKIIFYIQTIYFFSRT